MAVAYFLACAGRGFFPIVNGGETAVLYCFVFLYIFFHGSGPWSLDSLRRGSHEWLLVIALILLVASSVIRPVA
jgi:uncharacterized membrane protein YphA (DoxX/SURF4 family)